MINNNPWFIIFDDKNRKFPQRMNLISCGNKAIKRYAEISSIIFSDKLEDLVPYYNCEKVLLYDGLNWNSDILKNNLIGGFVSLNCSYKDNIVGVKLNKNLLFYSIKLALILGIKSVTLFTPEDLNEVNKRILSTIPDRLKGKINLNIK